MEVVGMSELFIKYGGGLAVTSISTFYGGLPAAVQALLIMMVLDYVSGVLASGIEGKISSKIGFKGILKKFLYLIIVVAAFMIDRVLGTEMIFMGTIYFLIANELFSLIENAGRAGLKLPPVLANSVDVLKQKGDNK